MLAYAGRPVRTALEVGAGTGKATRLFAARGIEVTAVEPDPEMAGVLRRTTSGLPVTTVVTTYERVSPDGRFDLLYAAAAWHWTDPATRWSRAVDLLVPGGVVALFGRPGELCDPGLAAAVAQVEQAVLPPDDTLPRWSIRDAAGLTDAVELDLPATEELTADDHLGRLATVSAYLTLEPRLRAATLQQVRAVLPERVVVDRTVRLALARRA